MPNDINILPNAYLLYTNALSLPRPQEVSEVVTRMREESGTLSLDCLPLPGSAPFNRCLFSLVCNRPLVEPTPPFAFIKSEFCKSIS